MNSMSSLASAKITVFSSKYSWCESLYKYVHRNFFHTKVIGIRNVRAETQVPKDDFIIFVSMSTLLDTFTLSPIENFLDNVSKIPIAKTVYNRVGSRIQEG